VRLPLGPGPRLTPKGPAGLGDDIRRSRVAVASAVNLAVLQRTLVWEQARRRGSFAQFLESVRTKASVRGLDLAIIRSRHVETHQLVST
jgi:hypothetical protein